MTPATEREPLTLFCFACSGASALPYMRWRRLATDRLHIAPVERPGRGGRAAEPHQRDFAALAEQLAEELAAQLTPRYALFGHSLGALLAFACAHGLRERGQAPPSALVAACCAAPSRRNDARFAHLRGEAALVAELQRLGGTPPDVLADVDLRSLVLDAAAADFALCASFPNAPRPKLDTPILVFGGRDDAIPVDDLIAWSAESTRPAALHMADGGHFFMRERESAFVAELERLLLAPDPARSGDLHPASLTSSAAARGAGR